MVSNCLPVIYYHSVADHPEPHPWAFLSTPRSVFISQMEYLKSKGYNTVTWTQLVAHLSGEKALPKKSVLIHFDDGFLDNWTVVYPIMERLGLKYSVVVSSDFIDPGDEVRHFVRDTNESNKPDWWGYLNAEELCAMEDSGLVDIQCHAKTHTWYESGPELVGRHGNSDMFTPWLDWNAYPEDKYSWLARDWQSRILKGAPILVHGKSLQIRRYFPSPEYLELLCRGMSTQEAKDYLGGDPKLGRSETDDELEARVEDELSTSRAILERILKKRVIGLVWPGGEACEIAIRKAKDLYSLVSKGTGLNRFGSRAFRFSRLAGSLSFRGKQIPFGQTLFLSLQLFRGRSLAMDTFAKMVKLFWR
ncbi:hypothetical protein ES706_04911 [subsurface metagenome]